MIEKLWIVCLAIGLTKYTHRKAKMEWDLAWFDKYLRGDHEAEESK